MTVIQTNTVTISNVEMPAISAVKELFATESAIIVQFVHVHQHTLDHHTQNVDLNVMAMWTVHQENQLASMEFVKILVKVPVVSMQIAI